MSPPAGRLRERGLERRRVGDGLRGAGKLRGEPVAMDLGDDDVRAVAAAQARAAVADEPIGVVAARRQTGLHGAKVRPPPRPRPTRTTSPGPLVIDRTA